jgi:hypothetical protein
MSNIYEVSERMHKIRAKLYPNYLPGSEGSSSPAPVTRPAVRLHRTAWEFCAVYDKLQNIVRIRMAQNSIPYAKLDPQLTM